MKIRIGCAFMAIFFSVLVAGASQEGDKKEKDGRPGMPIRVTPFYDSNGLKVSVGENSKKLASADAKSILDVSTELEKEKDGLRAEVMYVVAIRLYDLGHKDEAVYWFYTAQFAPGFSAQSLTRRRSVRWARKRLN